MIKVIQPVKSEGVQYTIINFLDTENKIAAWEIYDANGAENADYSYEKDPGMQETLFLLFGMDVDQQQEVFSEMIDTVVEIFDNPTAYTEDVVLEELVIN